MKKGCNPALCGFAAFFVTFTWNTPESGFPFGEPGFL